MRAKATADHAVTDADDRVGSLEASAADMRAKLNRADSKAAAALDVGDDAAVSEWRETIDIAVDLLDQAEVRIEAAKAEATELRERAGLADELAQRTQVAYDKQAEDGLDAEDEIDKLEQQADLYEKAERQLVKVEQEYGGDPPADSDATEWYSARTTLELVAEDLVMKADAITVDRQLINAYGSTTDEPAPVIDSRLMEPDGEAASFASASEPDGDTDTLGLEFLDNDRSHDRVSDQYGEQDNDPIAATTDEVQDDIVVASDDNFLSGATPGFADSPPAAWDANANDIPANDGDSMFATFSDEVDSISDGGFDDFEA